MGDRTFVIYYARVMLAECAHRRHSWVNRDFYWSLFADAQRARREAAALSAGMQRELFA